MAVVPIWQVRSPITWPDARRVVFDPLGSVPDLGPDLGGVDLVLGLAGVVPGRGEQRLNTDLGLASVDLAARLGARHVLLASSAAVYGGGDGVFSEQVPPAPVNDYGRAKLAMEQAALALGARRAVSVTALRIGNVAGADALLAGAGNSRVLDQFVDPSGARHGPRRSYIGPAAFARALAGLVGQAGQGADLPERLNVALDGAVDMADLCAAAGLAVTWRAAPPEALAQVVLDVQALACLVPVLQAQAGQIVADWQADQRRAIAPDRR
jgi:nucleoside-diphosphate-sugar epimerase